MPAVTLKEKAYDQLKKLLLSGDIQSNDQLTEKYLSELLQMSRTPIRAALEKLTTEGLLNYSPNKGLSLPELSLQNVIDFYDFRIAMEGYVAERLAHREWSDEEKAWFHDNLDEQKKLMEARDFVGFTDSDSAFHRKLLEIYGNREMMLAMDKLQDKLVQVAINVLRKDRNRIAISYEDHCQLFDLIVAGDAEEAKKKMVDHFVIGANIFRLQ